MVPKPLISPNAMNAISTSISSKGSSDGIDVIIIPPKKERYPDGAPVVVVVSPPLSAYKAEKVDTHGLTALGFIVVNFGYPAGEYFDKGGPNCKMALKDVLLFALGDKVDIKGRNISAISTTRITPRMTGAIGWSHGGNAFMTTLEAYPQELSGIKYYVSFENPCGTSKETLGGSILADYGRISFDPDQIVDSDHNGFPWDDGRNPYYSPEAGLDLSKLAWDPNAGFSIHGKDDTGRGVLFIDGNGNGKFDVGVDYPFEYFTYVFDNKTKRVYSLQIASACAKIFQKGFPEAIATPEEASGFWSERDMAANFENLSPSFDNMLICICSGREDHVQAATDYPHIRAQYNGLKGAHLRWVKINPDSAYISSLIEDNNFIFPDNAPNEETDPQNFWMMTTPTKGQLTHVVVAAALAEIADRVKAGRLRPNLKRTIFPTELSAPVQVPKNLWAPQQLNRRK